MLDHYKPRWITAYNAGLYDIPAFGLVEVANAEWTRGGPDGPSLTLRVQRPSSNSAQNIAICSWMPIPYQRTGFVTTAAPAVVAYTGTTLSAGDIIGSEADSFEPASGQTGLVFFGDVETSTRSLVSFAVDPYQGAGGSIDSDTIDINGATGETVADPVGVGQMLVRTANKVTSAGAHTVTLSGYYAGGSGTILGMDLQTQADFFVAHSGKWNDSWVWYIETNQGCTEVT